MSKGRNCRSKADSVEGSTAVEGQLLHFGDQIRARDSQSLWHYLLRQPVGFERSAQLSSLACLACSVNRNRPLLEASLCNITSRRIAPNHKVNSFQWVSRSRMFSDKYQPVSFFGAGLEIVLDIFVGRKTLRTRRVHPIVRQIQIGPKSAVNSVRTDIESGR
jgi:hypothetical protein